MNQIVIPGELVSDERKKIGSNVYVSNGRIYSKVLGITDLEGEYANVIPLNGKYMPVMGDVVIGVVKRVVFAGYELDINSFATTFIPRKAIREDLKLGDLVSAKIDYISELKEADLGFPRRLFGGEIIEVIPVRVPRLIGKGASMLELLKKGTGSSILIGKNGRVWAKDGDLKLLEEVIEFIEENSYKTNLTNTVQEFFEKKKKGEKK